MKGKKKGSHRLADWAWDAWCLASVVGIWPRFIEPRLLRTTQLELSFPQWPSALDGLRLLQLSDLHFYPEMPKSFYDKLLRKVHLLAPDILVFTGDFLCYADAGSFSSLEKLLQSFSAPYGCYAVYGNHDYAEYVTCSPGGKAYKGMAKPLLSKLLQPFRRPRKDRDFTSPPLHEELHCLLQRTPFHLLHNETIQLEVKGAKLNITGLGDLWAGHCLPQEAFTGYDSTAPGLVLAHNPDSIQTLQHFPGELVLSGHTHGGQANLPWLGNLFLSVQDRELKKGLVQRGEKTLYINRGLGSPVPFRWFAPPELTLIQIQRSTP